MSQISGISPDKHKKLKKKKKLKFTLLHCTLFPLLLRFLCTRSTPLSGADQECFIVIYFKLERIIKNIWGLNYLNKQKSFPSLPLHYQHPPSAGSAPPPAAHKWPHTRQDGGRAPNYTSLLTRGHDGEGSGKRGVCTAAASSFPLPKMGSGGHRWSAGKGLVWCKLSATCQSSGMQPPPWHPISEGGPSGHPVGPCSATDGQSWDSDGCTKPQGSACEIGAVEGRMGLLQPWTRHLSLPPFSTCKNGKHIYGGTVNIYCLVMFIHDSCRVLPSIIQLLSPPPHLCDIYII